MLARVCGTEGKLAGVGALGVDDAVVAVEHLVDGYGDGEVRVGGKDIVLGLEGAVMAYVSIGQQEQWMVIRKECLPTTRVSLGSSS